MKNIKFKKQKKTVIILPQYLILLLRLNIIQILYLIKCKNCIMKGIST